MYYRTTMIRRGHIVGHGQIGGDEEAPSYERNV
jgi:hypothetical protein